MFALPRRRLTTWLTLVALVLATLAPGIARAMAFAQGDATAWGLVCSAAMSEARNGGQAPVDRATHALKHCAFCSLQGHAPGLPPAPLALADMPALSHAVPQLFLHAPHPLPAWQAAQARAPPLSC